ncbi:ribonuclease P protein subunit p14-like [Xenia sp. Carnegie-2017]|uniref:ribonuclease P protein subunit p14-like n=1 Tax=Xenia sp. Carnegie-2017 TaxID=2897299 RepID=UPI001F047F46|nr:ribonuclease P protein subunit p14-like [Xenia sp. Carnegie-2017]
MSKKILTAPQKCEHCYLKCILEEEVNGLINTIILEPVQLKSFIVSAVKQLHGSVGSSTVIDILKVDKRNGEIILRVKSSNLVKLWSSLTLINKYNDNACRFNVQQVSPYLMSLARDSRTWVPFISSD